MTGAGLIMLGLGAVALVAGLAMLLRRGGSAASVTARRIAGTMLAALGATLLIFSLGLAGKLELANA